MGPEGNITECVIKGKFRTHGIRGTNPVAVGDKVVFELPAKEITGIIKEIDERKNYIIRKSPNLSREYQILAANIDQCVLMLTIKEPETQLEFVDRFLVAAEAFRIPVVLLFNKYDIYDRFEREHIEHLVSVYEAAGYSCMKLSLSTGEGFAKTKSVFSNKTTLVAGNSGVGKSTLLMKLIPGLDLKTDIVSEAHKQGRHTTTFAEMFMLPGGGRIIDTPGIKGFGLSEFVREEIYHFFPEIFRLSEKCRYNNCLHIDEPGCAVKEAAEDGRVEWTRYRSYINIMYDTNTKYR